MRKENLQEFELDMFTLLYSNFIKFAVDAINTDKIFNAAIEMYADSNVHVHDKGYLYIADGAKDEFRAILADEINTGFISEISDNFIISVTDVYNFAQSETYDDIKKTRFKASAVPDFDAIDERTIESLGNSGIFWIQDAFEEGLQTQMNNIVESVLAQGESAFTLAEKLKENFGDLVQGTEWYWYTVSSAVLNRTRNFANIRQYVKAGITKYEIVAVRDDRTTEICKFMDGRVFTVENAVNVIEDTLEANEPQDIKDSHPWLGWDEETGVPIRMIDGKETTLPNDTAELESLGVSVPPFHGGCRTTTVMSRE